MRLSCPVCRSDMEPVEFMGIKLDVCTECAGLWFDSGELTDLAKHSPDAMERLEERFTPELEIVDPPPALKRCPRCHITLDSYHYHYDSPVKIDSCQNCNGVFVEEHELAGIHEAIENDDRVHLTAAMEARARLAGRPVPVVGGRNAETDVSALIKALSHWRDRTGAKN